MPFDHEDCPQAESISSIHTTIKRIEATQHEDRVERREFERRFMEVLEKVADSSARITNLESSFDHCHHDVDMLFERQRAIELKLATPDTELEEITRFYHWTTNKYARSIIYSILGIITLNTITELWWHGQWIFNLLHKIIAWFNGQ